MIVNRLVLNLSHSANEREESESRSSTKIEAPVFASNSFLGNIGGTMRSIPNDVDDDLSETEDDDSFFEDEVQDNLAGFGKYNGSEYSSTGEAV